MGHVLANCLSPTHFGESLAEGDRYIKKAVKRLGRYECKRLIKGPSEKENPCVRPHYFRFPCHNALHTSRRGQTLQVTKGPSLYYCTHSVLYTDAPLAVFHSDYTAVDIANSAKVSQLCTSACGALGDMFRSGPLPLPIGDLPTDLEEKFGTPKAKEAVKVLLGRSGDELTQLDLVLYLSNLLMSAKEIKVNLRLVYKCTHIQQLVLKVA